MQTNLGDYENYPDVFFFEENEFSQEGLLEFIVEISCIWQVINSILPFVFRSFIALFLNLVVFALTGMFFYRPNVLSLIMFCLLSRFLNECISGVIGFALFWTNSERFALVLPLLIYFLQSFALINFNPIRNISRGFLCTIFTIIFIIMW
ncbi:hypothetical protein Mgra_00009219 [Meloidogyne graminicola]|uniref:Uncharacterized protein n=1 Tax=Meloidogyne graminicola TaxID=189291 RepID=A0A8S9ZDJ8_9BILA|nr:hypothetical protein Mgra_00009219 [Meloidogyne graminicola]